MNESVKLENLERTISRVLTEYSDEVAERTKRAVDKATEEAAEEIKLRIPFRQRTRKYVRSFAIKTAYEDRLNKRNVWYVKGKEYRKTHLLENGHVNRDGTHTRAYPHIRYGEEIARKRLPELCEKAINGEEIQ